jgi:hypothetical protein
VFDPDRRPDSPPEVTTDMIADAVSRLDTEAMMVPLWGMSDAHLLDWAKRCRDEVAEAVERVIEKTRERDA